MFKLIEKICKELSVKAPEKSKEKIYSLPVNDEILITIYDSEPYIYLKCNFSPMIETKKEDLLIYLMRANLLNQGTGGSKLGLSSDEKFLTLLYTMPYELEYEAFRDNIEDFVNYAGFYKEEVDKYIEKIKESVL